VTDPIGPKLRALTDQQLAAVIDSSDDAILVKDLQGVIHSWNRGAERLFGYSATEVIGKPVTVLIPPDRKDEEPHILRLIASGESIDHYTTVRCRKDGSLIDISLSVTPIRDSNGRVIGATKLARDVSEARLQRQQQELLAQAEKRLAELVEASDSAIISCDRLGVIQTWNKGAEHMYGYRADDAIGGRVTVLIPDGRNEEKRRLLEILSVDERVGGYAMTGRRKDGTAIDTSVDISPLRDLAGNVVGAWLIAQRAAKAKSA